MATPSNPAAASSPDGSREPFLVLATLAVLAALGIGSAFLKEHLNLTEYGALPPFDVNGLTVPGSTDVAKAGGFNYCTVAPRLEMVCASAKPYAFYGVPLVKPRVIFDRQRDGSYEQRYVTIEGDLPNPCTSANGEACASPMTKVLLAMSSDGWVFTGWAFVKKDVPAAVVITPSVDGSTGVLSVRAITMYTVERELHRADLEAQQAGKTQDLLDKLGATKVGAK